MGEWGKGDILDSSPLVHDQMNIDIAIVVKIAGC